MLSSAMLSFFLYRLTLRLYYATDKSPVQVEIFNVDGLDDESVVLKKNQRAFFLFLF